jgi:hypothetical protein
MTEIINKYMEIQNFIDSIICNYPGIKFLEYNDKLTVKNNKFEYIYTIQNRFYNSRGEKYQEKWCEDFKKMQNIKTKGQMKILHGCRYSNLKRRSHLISFSTVFLSFDEKNLIPGSTIKIGYMDELCKMQIISNSRPTEEFISYKIFPMVGLCRDSSCIPRFLRCVYENKNIIDDLEKIYEANIKDTYVIDNSLEDQLEDPESYSKKLEDPIKLPSVR